MRSAQRNDVKSLEGVPRMNRVRNEDVRRKSAIETVLASPVDQRVLRWFGHVERMDEYCMPRCESMAEIMEGGLDRP